MLGGGPGPYWERARWAARGQASAQDGGRRFKRAVPPSCKWLDAPRQDARCLRVCFYPNVSLSEMILFDEVQVFFPCSNTLGWLVGVYWLIPHDVIPRASTLAMLYTR